MCNKYLYFLKEQLSAVIQPIKKMYVCVCVRLYAIVVLERNTVVFSSHSWFHEMSMYKECLFAVFSMQCVLHEATHRTLKLSIRRRYLSRLFYIYIAGKSNKKSLD